MVAGVGGGGGGGVVGVGVGVCDVIVVSGVDVGCVNGGVVVVAVGVVGGGVMW